MNPRSIGDWLDVIADLYPRTLASLHIEANVDSIPLLAQAGITRLKVAKKEDDIHSLDHIWWVSQCLKKFRYGVPQTVRAKSIAGFIERNERARGLRIPRSLVDSMRRALKAALPEPVEYMSLPTRDQFAEKGWRMWSLDDGSVGGRHGPGAVYEHWDALDKWARGLRGETLEAARSMRLCEWAAVCSGENICRVQAVPKQYDKYRIITVETCQNAWAQQYVRSLLLASIHSGPLRGTAMDITSGRSRIAGLDAWDLGQVLGTQVYDNCGFDPLTAPSYNDVMAWNTDGAARQRMLCDLASEYGTLATLDMKDASDSISYEQVVEVFPSWVLAYLDLCRSPSVMCDGEVRPLWLYAGMGNATTFVVETLYFWAYIRAVAWALGFGRKQIGHTPIVSVFGDDIITDSTVCEHPQFTELLLEGGLVINWDKSASGGRCGFREACGAVTLFGRRLRQLLRIPGFRGVRDPTFAGFLTRLDRHGDDTRMLSRRLLWYFDELPVTSFRLAEDDVGIVQMDGFDRGEVRARWNGNYQRMEVRAKALRSTYREYTFNQVPSEVGLGILHGQLKTTGRGRKTTIKVARPKRPCVRSVWVEAF